MLSKVVILLSVTSAAIFTAAQNDENAFRQWFEQEYNPKVGELMFKEVDASWNYETNLTEFNQEIMVNTSGETAKFVQDSSWEMKRRFGNISLSDSSLNRLHRKLSMIGDAALSADEYKELKDLISKMSDTYSTAVVCAIPGTSLANCPADKKWNMEPGITRAFDDPSTNEAVLSHVWKSWREESGKKMRQQYLRYIELKNKAAQANGYKNNAQLWRNPYVEPDFNYTDADFLKEIKGIFEQIKPLYQQLHAYVRAKLREKHGATRSTADGPIPAHLLGNMWAQSWLGVLNFTQLYANKPKLDVTEEMIRQGYNATRMFQTADKFFADLGLIPMPTEFWEKSMIEKPEGRNVTCHASAWDFYNAKDFRIKQCTDVTMQDLFTVHHEMGHVEYFLQYKNNSIPFRDGANDGFHEAIGDVLALSVSTPGHLQKIGLMSNVTSDEASDLNFQFSTALEKIAFLPFGLMLDMYRYDVFSGIIREDELNRKWWEYVVEYQGICAPDNWRGEDFFDPGAKYHVPADVPYMRYFVSFIIQFQFHKALCDKAGHKGPLYTCDIDGNKEAGALLAKTLALGASQPWQKAMETITGNTKMDAQPLLDFFQPLMKHLTELNKNDSNPVGWKNVPYCPTQSEAKSFQAFAEEDFNPTVQNITYKSQEASWAYNTNITNHNRDLMFRETENAAKYDKTVAEYIKAVYNESSLTNATHQRLYQKMSKMGDSALPEALFTELQEVTTKMSQTYSTALVCRDQSVSPDQIDRCPKDQQMALEPDITKELAESQDPHFLLYLWKSWRDASGKKIRSDYKRYVELKNEAAKLDGYKTTAEAWRAPYVEPTKNYTDADFLQEAKQLWTQLEPFYKQLHAYVRHALIKKYPEAKIAPNGPIPAHLLGNMWAQTWGALQNFTQLFPNKPSLDVTNAMVKQKYDANKMFRTSDQFFKDLGLIEMPDLFWNKSMIVKPEGRNVTCHASAWDFYNQKDFRIKQCTDVTMDDFITVHHEMGHVEYYLQYKDLPVPFRRGANDGFHEAVGDVLALSVSTPGHLKKIGLLSAETPIDDQMDKNFMYSTALDKVAFLPFGFLMDMYRYDIFSGAITPENYNSKWWEYRVKYQGVCAPVARSEDDFDAGSKYHIPADVPYMRYFVSFVIQFQFHKALCAKANHSGPLYTCDIDGNKEAGKLLGEALKLGSSIPWQDTMKVLTGQEKMDAQPLLEFFAPLLDYLREENSRNGAMPNWTTDATCIQYPRDTTTVKPAGSATSSQASFATLFTAIFVVLVGIFRN